MAQSITWQATLGACTLIMAISLRAALLPATSIFHAALSTTGSINHDPRVRNALSCYSVIRDRTAKCHPLGVARCGEFVSVITTGSIEAFPYNFSEPHELEKSLRGIDALINTYWVRSRDGGNDCARDRGARPGRVDAVDARLPGCPRAWLDGRGCDQHAR